MKICPINYSYYSNINPKVQNKNFPQKNNISFGASNRYELALDIQKKKDDISKLNNEIAELSTKLSETLREFNNIINQKITERSKAEEELKNCENEYKVLYNPSMIGFDDDVKKGLEMVSMPAKTDNDTSSTSSDTKSVSNIIVDDDDDWDDYEEFPGSNYENRATQFSAADGWPLYTP